MITTAHPAHSERRRSPRRQPTQGTTCQLETDAGASTGWGLVWNISETGVSILFGKALPPGTEVRGALLAADGENSLDLNMRIAHLRALSTGDFFLGGHFHRPLTAQQLEPFVGVSA